MDFSRSSWVPFSWLELPRSGFEDRSSGSSRAVWRFWVDFNFDEIWRIWKKGKNEVRSQKGRSRHSNNTKRDDDAEDN